MATERYKKSQLIEAIEKSEFGSKSEISDLLGCHVKTFNNYLKRYPEVAEAYEYRKESLCDWVESQLYKEIKKGNITAIIFWLKTQGKLRGYVERTELTGADGGAIEVDDARESIQRKLAAISTASGEG